MVAELKSASRVRLVVVTPEQTVLETDASFVALPLFDGELGVAAGHIPMIGRLGYGELRVRQGDATSRYYVDGGFVQVADNVVSVLTNRALTADKIDAAAAEAQLKTALAKLASGEEIAIRDRLVAQARGQIRVARKG